MPRKTRSTLPITLDWRPHSYWDHADPISAILVNVKGTIRRSALRARLEGRAPELPVEPLLRDDLPDDERLAWGRIHPACMGGEYLPGYLPGEVEIARIVFQSTLGDVVSIRARRRRGGKRICYRVVDEYPEMHRFIVVPRSSTVPLSLGAILELVWNLRSDADDDTEAFLQRGLRCNLEASDDPESMTTFIRVESLIYPELERLAGERLAAWLRQLCADRYEADDEI